MMRRNPLFAVFCIFAFPGFSYGQFENESPIPYFRYSVTIAPAATLLYSDLNKAQIGPALSLRGNYFMTHGLSLGLEIQEGMLRATDNVPINEVLRKSSNLYHAAIVGVNFQPIKYMQDDHLRRIEYRQPYGKRVLSSVYVGIGMGILYSMQWDQHRVYGPVETTDANGNPIIVETILPEYQGRNQGLSYFMSTNFGLELPLHSLKPDLLDSYIWSLVFNAQLNFSFDDELDGYSGAYPGNENKDSFGLLSIGINLRF